MSILKWIIGLFVKRAEIILQEGVVKYRVKGVTIGIFFFNFCVAGVWKEDKNFNSVGLIWLNKGFRLVVEVEEK